MEPGGLGRVLSDLLQPDNALIQQATAQLREAFRHPEVLPQLCQLLAGAPDPQIRQLAAVLLRRRLTKHWRKLNPEEQDRLKSLVLGALQQEAEHQVSVALAQLAALLLRHQGLERWPQLLQLIQQGVRGPDPHLRQISLLVLSSALESDPEAFAPHYSALLRLFHSALGQHGQPGALYYCLRGLAAMAAGLGADHLNLMHSLVPKIISAVRQLISINEVHASEAMEVFDELMESEVSVIVQHLSDVVGFCLEVASSRVLGDALRVKALSTLSFLIKLRGKAMLKQRLLPPVLDALFPILSAEPPLGQLDAEDQECEDEGDEAQTPKHMAAQVIDMLALHLPPEKLFPQLMPHLEPALQSPRPYERKAGLMVLAVLAEGCGDHIRTRHLQSLLGVICRALADESLVVRSAALFALGQFSENLQPDIAAYAGEVLPLLLSYLGGVEPVRGGHLAKAYYALENFVESLGAGIEPFLPVLMEQTLGTLRSPGGPRPKELAISALGAIASAAQRAMGLYLPHVLEQLRRFLPPAAPQEQRPLQCQAVETLGALVRALGREAVGPLAEESCQLGLGLAEGQDDPDLRRCTYSLFAALSCAMGDDLAPHLPRITTLLLYSLKSTEGLVPPAGDTSSFLLFEDEEAEVEGEEDLDGEDDEEEEEELFGLSVESAYVDEKEDACAALGEIAANASVAFLPHLESCVPEVFQLLERCSGCWAWRCRPWCGACTGSGSGWWPWRCWRRWARCSPPASRRRCGAQGAWPSSAGPFAPCWRGRQPARMMAWMRKMRRMKSRRSTMPCCWSTRGRGSLLWPRPQGATPSPRISPASCPCCSTKWCSPPCSAPCPSRRISRKIKPFSAASVSCTRTPPSRCCSRWGRWCGPAAPSWGLTISQQTPRSPFCRCCGISPTAAPRSSRRPCWPCPPTPAPRSVGPSAQHEGHGPSLVK
ncbi:importin-4 isoform X5 [Eretmochelys imbricata]